VWTAVSEVLSDVLICFISEHPDHYPYLEINREKLIRSKPGEPVPQADVYVWDYAPGTPSAPPVSANDPAQHLVLVDSKHLDEIGALPESACILLKPVSAFTLRAFLEMAWKTWQFRQQAREAATLRLDRDALLQYVLEVNLKLQEYDQERSNFLARAIHDFRAPLTALHGYCGLLAEGKLGAVNSGQRELLERMRYSTSRLTRLAGGTLELLTEGRVTRTPNRTEGDIEEALDQALQDVYPFLQDKQIEIDVQIEPAAGSLLFETELIQQVLMNLLENSTKFTPRDGRITVRGYPVEHGTSASAHASGPGAQAPDSDSQAPYFDFQAPFSDFQERIGEGYRMDIMDSGPGVPAHLAEKIFEQYASYRGTGDRSGGGLGLAICRAIVVAHGGAIWATPSRDGGCFSFVLPAHPVRKNPTSTAYSSLQLA